jgi:hypothetical protein
MKKNWENLVDEIFQGKRCVLKNCPKNHNEEGCHEFRIRVDIFESTG